jgi:hypothetical protein
MKALTLTQPWASLVSLGMKKIETSSWSTPYRGLLLIHAGAGLGPVGGKKGLQRLCDRVEFANALWHAGVRKGEPPNDSWADVLPLGAIIAVCKLDCVSTNEIHPRWWRQYYGGRRWEMTEQEWAFGDYSREPKPRYAWLLADVQALPEPVPCKGALGLWQPDAATMDAVRRQVQHAEG